MRLHHPDDVVEAHHVNKEKNHDGNQTPLLVNGESEIIQIIACQ